MSEKIYVPVEEQVTVYSGVSRTNDLTFDASVFNANPTIKAIQGTITYVKTSFDVDTGNDLYACIDGVETLIFDRSATIPVSEYGINFTVFAQDHTYYYVDLTSTTQTQIVRKQASKIYVPVEKQVNYYSGAIRTGGAGNITAFDEEVFNANPTIKALQKEINYLEVDYDMETGVYLDVYFTDSTVQTLVSVVVADLVNFGIAFNPHDDGTDYIDLTITTQTQTVRKAVSKVYVPVYDSTTQTYRRKLAFSGV